ncbi:MAG TPA: ABC transporter ATP-binding protein [Gammaproteobacteria bacterium]|nr:ABC transporter ATP-binding protein [Gammaproteobacteria bacterium]
MLKTMPITPFILSAVRPFRWQILGLIFVACYWAAHLSLQPYVIKLIIDGVNHDPSIRNMIIPVILYILLAIAFTLNFRFYDFVALKFYPKLKANIVEQSTEVVSHYSYRFFQNQLSGGLSDKIKNLSKGTTEIVGLIVDRFFSHVLAFFIACGTLMLVNYWLAIILFGWAILLLTISIYATKRGRQLSHEFSEMNSLLIGKNVDRFTNILNVKLFSAYQYEKNELNKSVEKVISKDQKLRWFLLKLMTIQGLSTAGMISGCILVLIYLVQSQSISAGDFALVLTLTLSFSEIIGNLAHGVSQFSEVYGTVSQGLALLNKGCEIKDAPKASELRVTKGEICFQKVHFRYDNADPLFSNKSIILRAGEKIGLVGYSGSGKSTFVNLILRLFDVNSGNILIDNQDIKQVTQDSLHRALAMIPQDPILFHRTIMDNIRYGQLNAEDQEVIEAAKKANAHEFISCLPEGYNSLVGERGVKLSGGQRQRIAIARAILKNAPILLLDEATSALDSVTENSIKQTLIEVMQGKTTIVIAHRLGTLLHMDRILVFDQGKIVEEGTHSDLLEKAGMYKKLWDAQVGGFIPDLRS